MFGFTFIHLLTTAERKNCAVEGSQRINMSAEKPMNRAFVGRLKLLKDFWGHSSREGYFSSKDGYAYQKEDRKTLKTCRKMSQFLSQVSRNLVAGFADSWHRNILFDFIAVR